MRIILDTNVLIDGMSDEMSVQTKLINAVREGRLEACSTPRVTKEYQKIVQQLITNKEYKDRMKDFITKIVHVKPREVHIHIDDEEDRKFLEAGVGGKADLLVTNDRHLLDIGEIGAMKVVDPQEAWTRYEESSKGSDAWSRWLQGIGIGH